MSGNERKTEHKTLPFATKEVTEDGQFEGFLAAMGNVDLGADVIDMGAFKRTLDHSGGELPILWFHKEDVPLGLFSEMREVNVDQARSIAPDEVGALLAKFPDIEGFLHVKGQLDLDTQPGREKHSGMLKGYIDAMSIGYKSIVDEIVDGIRHLKELALGEGSLLTKGWAMNPAAVTTAVKSLEGIEAAKALEFDETLIDHDEQRARSWSRLYDLFWAFECTVDSVMAAEGHDMRDLAEAASVAFGAAVSEWTAAFIEKWAAVDETACAECMTAYRDLEEKIGRVLSSTNVTQLTAAAEAITAVLESARAEDDEEDEDGKSLDILPPDYVDLALQEAKLALATHC